MTAAHYAAQSDCAAAIDLIMSLHMEDLVKRAGYIDSMAQAGQPVKVDDIVEPDNIAIDRPSRSGATPLHVAACFDAKDAVNVLLRYNVNVSDVCAEISPCNLTMVSTSDKCQRFDWRDTIAQSRKE